MMFSEVILIVLAGGLSALCKIISLQFIVANDFKDWVRNRMELFSGGCWQMSFSEFECLRKKIIYADAIGDVVVRDRKSVV